jgi:antirestriction protein ArdC
MSNASIRSEIATKIAEAVKRGCPPWRAPWGNNDASSQAMMSGLPRNFISGRRYSGINPLIIMGANYTHGFHSPYWGSVKQWNSIGAYIKPRPTHVRNGEWGTSIIFYATMEKKDQPPDEEKEKFRVLRRYSVFNVEQAVAPEVNLVLYGSPKVQKELAKNVLGKSIKKMTRPMAVDICKKVETKLAAMRGDNETSIDTSSCEYAERAEAFLTATGAKIIRKGTRAFYRTPPADYIQLPPVSYFDSVSNFYETAFHELCHFCEADHRVGQSPKHKGYKGSAYAFSELVAEIGACFLAMEIGIPYQKDMLPRSESYVQHWLTALGNDPKYVFEAATQASAVVDYLLGFMEEK